MRAQQESALASLESRLRQDLLSDAESIPSGGVGDAQSCHVVGHDVSCQTDPPDTVSNTRLVLSLQTLILQSTQQQHLDLNASSLAALQKQVTAMNTDLWESFRGSNILRQPQQLRDEVPLQYCNAMSQ